MEIKLIVMLNNELMTETFVLFENIYMLFKSQRSKKY